MSRIVITDAKTNLIGQIHASGQRLVLAVTGGGSGAISALLEVPGASRSVLAATVPYAPEALTEWLGGKPHEFCSAQTARAMAMAARMKAQHYAPEGSTRGVACTASLASDRPKRGPHRAHLAWQSGDTTAEFSLELEKGRRSRVEEEALVAALVLNVVAEACGVESRIELPLLPSEQIQSRSIVASPEQQDLLAGRTHAVGVHVPQGGRAIGILPGAFHPVHVGHRQMAAVARELLGGPVAFELTIDNVDKPPLDLLEIDQRVRQFGPDEWLYLTRAPNFTQKAQIFPGATFVVGADTITRVGHPRYYGGSEEALQTGLQTIARQGCRFLVFGRQVQGSFCTLRDLALPAELARLCQEVPPEKFREDISSTQLRERAQRGD